MLRNLSKTFSLECESDSNANYTTIIPPFFTGVHFLTDNEQAVPLNSDKWMKGLRVFYSCKDYWEVD